MRRAGILLHPTSLPGPCGLGDIGPTARDFAAWLESAGQRIWQTLPLNPTDDGGSPYTSPSAFARSPMLLSPEDLLADGWLRPGELPRTSLNPHRVDYRAAARAKTPVLELAARRVVEGGVDLEAYAATAGWIREWALYATLLEDQGPYWLEWPEALRQLDADALADVRARRAGLYDRHVALQWLFKAQWARLREETTRRGIELWGDMPFFVGAVSAETWAHRELFRLDTHGRPEVISGVPPDAFSPEGQLWGHPHYDESAHAAQGYRWWGDRTASLLDLFDRVRIDHFRGVEAVWEVASDADNAMEGTWIPGPGAPLLEALRERFGGLPLIAEDLGIITPEVEALRDGFGLPGMAILQFAFGHPFDPEHPYLPQNYAENLVVYPGTHDNNTVLGWYRSAPEMERHWARRVLSVDGGDIAWDMIRAAYHSVARYAVVNMQDVLRLGPDARMNIPGVAEGNWGWRMVREAMNVDVASALREESWLAGRTS